MLLLSAVFFKAWNPLSPTIDTPILKQTVPSGSRMRLILGLRNGEQVVVTDEDTEGSVNIGLGLYMSLLPDIRVNATAGSHRPCALSFVHQQLINITIHLTSLEQPARKINFMIQIDLSLFLVSISEPHVLRHQLHPT